MPGTTFEDFTMQEVGECVVLIHHDTNFIRTALPSKPDHDPTAYINARMQAMNARSQTGRGTEMVDDSPESREARRFPVRCGMGVDPSQRPEFLKRGFPEVPTGVSSNRFERALGQYDQLSPTIFNSNGLCSLSLAQYVTRKGNEN